MMQGGVQPIFSDGAKVEKFVEKVSATPFQVFETSSYLSRENEFFCTRH
jgi:hypothetical protein